MLKCKSDAKREVLQCKNDAESIGGQNNEALMCKSEAELDEKLCKSDTISYNELTLNILTEGVMVSL